MNFIITVDTEADNQWKARNRGDNLRLDNIYALPRFQKLAQSYAFKPVYLLSYEVANDKPSVEILKPWQGAGEAEIGSHLHPWSCPPFKNEKEKILNRFPSSLTRDEFSNKLSLLTRIITDNFNKSPISFRAGRWGFSEWMADYLFDNGYRVDCSVTPKINWSNQQGLSTKEAAPNFISYPVNAFYINSFDMKKKLLEVPMTIIPINTIVETLNLYQWFDELRDTVIKKIFAKTFFKLQWCRIDVKTNVRNLKKLFYRAKKNEYEVLEFMIHSSELIKGGSPMVRTERDREIMYFKINEFFKFLFNEKVDSVTLEEFYNMKNFM